jgi:uncharacterized UBP type Zn finger protein
MEVNQLALDILIAYGFGEDISTRALIASENSIDIALDWLVEHKDD